MALFGDLVSGMKGFIENKPEQFAIMADTLGQGFDPNNPFAGIGTMMGQSSLASKQMQQERQERQDWQKFIGSILSGQTPTTAPGEPGVSGATIKPSKDGGSNEVTISITEPTEQGKIDAVKNQKVKVGDLMQLPF